MTLNGEFSHYEVQDYLLTGYNTLRVKSAYGNYNTRKVGKIFIVTDSERYATTIYSEKEYLKEINY